jgi:RimJ/RimL family protein N-acetyltransferase
MLRRQPDIGAARVSLRTAPGLSGAGVTSQTVPQPACEELTPAMIDYCEIEGRVIRTPRLVLRPWTDQDVTDALSIYGNCAVAHWLEPQMSLVPDTASMADILDGWISENENAVPPVGRWAISLPTFSGGREVVGGAALLPFGPAGEDLQVAWQLQPTRWGEGLATEAGHALAHYAFAHGAAEIFAVVRPHNRRAAALAGRVGMEWVGETDKYDDLELQVYRLLQADLDLPVGGVSVRRPQGST